MRFHILQTKSNIIFLSFDFGFIVIIIKLCWLWPWWWELRVALITKPEPCVGALKEYDVLKVNTDWQKERVHEDFITTPQTHYMTHTLPMSADRREWVFNKMSRRSEERCYLVSVVSADVTQRRRCRLAEWGVDHAGGLRSRRITSQDWKDGGRPGRSRRGGREVGQPLRKSVHVDLDFRVVEILLSVAVVRISISSENTQH